MFDSSMVNEPSGFEPLKFYCILHADSLRMVSTKYESYILHTSEVMYNYQNLNKAINDKVGPDLDLALKI